MRTPGLLVVIVLLGVLAGPLFAYSAGVQLLPPDQSVEGSVVLSDADQAAAYQITVSDDVFAIRVEITDAPADLDLYLSDTDGEVVAYSELTDYNESLFLSRLTDPALLSGRFTLEVAYGYDRPPLAHGVRLDEIPFRVQVHTIRLRPTDTLRPGDTITGELIPENAMVAFYRVIVPEHVNTLRLDISDTDADADLFLSYRGMPADPFQADHVSQTLRSSESIVIDRSSAPALRTGTYYLLVADQVALDSGAEFHLSVSDTADAPPELGVVPVLPTPASDLDRALLATVEVIAGSGGGGSGCILSSAGVVLTNFHVVRADNGQPDPDLTLGVSLDNARPPVELFRAEVIEYSEELDLALLRVTGDRYGRQLSPEIEFPFLNLRVGEPSIGEALEFVGYPGVGGTGSRASITFTTGVVAGFQRTASGSLIKTDGEINSGSSGGAALDTAYRLVGVPTSVVGEDSGQLAYIVPVTDIPSDWMEHIR